MKNKIDKALESKRDIRDRAMQFVKSFAEEQLKNYDEPKRLGTPKGDPIGHSRKKYYTAIMMILYPNCLKLKEIAKLSGVSNGVLRIWRTEEQFKKAVKEASILFGERIANFIEEFMQLKLDDDRRMDVIRKSLMLFDRTGEEPKTIIKDTENIRVVRIIISLLPFVNFLVVKLIINLIKEGLKKNLRGYAALNLQFIHEWESSIDKDLEKFDTTPEMLRIKKNLISNTIDILSTYELNAHEIQEYSDGLKKLIFSTIDSYAR